MDEEEAMARRVIAMERQASALELIAESLHAMEMANSPSAPPILVPTPTNI